MLYTAFFVGLMGSFHCIGMCGPIALMLPLERHDSTKRIVQLFLYHFGRLFSYGLLGALLGSLGLGFYLAGIQRQLSITLGCVMLISGLMAWLHVSTKTIGAPLFGLYGKLSSVIGSRLRKPGNHSLILIGLANGLLPCGLVYLAALGALGMQNPAQGFWYMVFFGVGTIPMMTLASYMGNFLSPKLRSHFIRWIPVGIIGLGILFILRGMDLGIPLISPKLLPPQLNTEIECESP